MINNFNSIYQPENNITKGVFSGKFNFDADNLTTRIYLATDATNSPKTQKNEPVKSVAKIFAGGYAAYQAIVSGARRALGLRIEEHTTSIKNAKDIIKEGLVLNPKYGGSKNSKLFEYYGEASKNFVHITGLHKDLRNAMGDSMDFDGKFAKYVLDTPLSNLMRPYYRGFQKIMYRVTSKLSDQELKILTDKQAVSSVEKIKLFFKILTPGKAKTFYVPGTDKFFNDNFIPDADDFALKSMEMVKVCKTKIGATIKGLKEFGLSGIKENKCRAVAGAGIFAALGVLSYKLISSGLKNMKNGKG